MLLLMAWRNIWRNKTRSLLVMLSVVIGLWAGLVTMSFVRGLYAQNIKDTIKNYLSHFQVHNPEYVVEHNINKTITLSEHTYNMLRNDKRIKGVSPRFMTEVMMASPVNAIGVNAIGIIPQFEDSVTRVYSRLIEGTQLKEGKANGVLIGEKVAKKLKLKLKSKVVLSFQDAQGDITSAAFRVQGIFRSSNTSFDEANVYVMASQIQALCLMDSSSYHELAILLNNNEDQTAVKPELQKIFKGQLLRDWMQLSPELDLIINSFNLYMYIFIGIILLALSFGIINTMLMSVLERVRELGMLMAICMNKPRIFFMIILETILLSLAGSPLGFLISYLTIYYFGVHGLDLSVFSEGLSSFGYASIIYTELDPDFYFKIYFMTLFAALFASLFPAYKALRLKPVDAIRKI
jgi:putative ABC transport system permease protein